jgi:hypothetical protein
MQNSRRDAILEIYQLLLAIFLFVSPWACIRSRQHRH